MTNSEQRLRDDYLELSEKFPSTAHPKVFDFILSAHREVVKAFGGCNKCYGKGYSTSKVNDKNNTRPCVCDRGKQIKEIQEANFLEGVDSVDPRDN